MLKKAQYDLRYKYETKTFSCEINPKLIIFPEFNDLNSGSLPLTE